MHEAQLQKSRRRLEDQQGRIGILRLAIGPYSPFQGPKQLAEALNTDLMRCQEPETYRAWAPTLT